ncbi:MAG: type VII toxin-antitoxin system MntA family adenylyltransferase antitoxin [Persicimonas sp.]
MTSEQRQPKIAHADEVASLLVEHLPELRFAYVFGSAAADRLGPDSDFDIAVDAGRRLEADELMELSGRLASVVGRTVDLVDLLDAGAILNMQVLRRGRLITCRDERALAEFKMYTPSIYADWKHLRRPIDEALIRRIRS